jgi:hypothetical protein
VRQAEGTFWFRLYNTSDPSLWELHGWVPWEAIQQAAAMYRGNALDPLQAYDLDLARALMEEES